MSNVSESPEFLKVLSDGSVERFYPEIASASSDPTRGFVSKDIDIDPSKPISARIFVPAGNYCQQLPVIVYFHGGGFCIGSTSWLGYHVFLGDLSAKAKCIVFSIDYRLAPENRLPIAYDDCYTAVQWLAQNVNTEPWLKQADITHVFLSGDSAGANITHHIAIKAIKDNACGVKILGVLSIHPYFGSEERTEKEMEKGGEGEVASNDMFWGLSIPEGSNRDFYGCNYEKGEFTMDEWARFPNVVVFVAGLDFLKERGVMYAEFLREKRVKGVKLIEAEGEKHVYHVFYPESEATRLLQQQISDFIHSF